MRLFQPSIARFSQCEVLKATHRDVGRSRPPSFGGRRPSYGSYGPWRRFVNWLERIPQDYIFYGIIAVNAAVFASWGYAHIRLTMRRNPDLYIWMRQHFTVSWQNVKNGRPYTLLSSCFSHEDWGHILMNGFTYFFMAPFVLQTLGNARFLALYFGGGLVSSMTSLQFNKDRPGYASHGASGAIYAVISYFACMAPRATFLLFGIVPMPAWAFVGGVFLFDSYSAMSDIRKGTDTAGHVGGLLAGIGYFFLRARFRL
ncbi:rhomboid-domain-containing protein [Dentipellis sp. KUC8613]|nr:rhomboid-domain-containing protein [Dentipellis sp. KUC8613]